MSGEYPVKVLRATIEASRSGYYAWVHSTESTYALRDQELGAKIALVHQQSRETYGSPRITVELRAQGESVGRHRRRSLDAAGRPTGPAAATVSRAHHRQPTLASDCAQPPRGALSSAPTKPNQV